jgi:hypothetical protein
MTHPTKAEMLAGGQALVERFCALNGIEVPGLEVVSSNDWSFGVCAYYRPSTTRICLVKCAAVGVAGPAWSYPGYSVDRTPYGVLAHELGHHVDVLKSDIKRAYFGNFSVNLHTLSGEAPISSYSPNPAEWFAEMFRVFVTNPDLLRVLRPRTHAELVAVFKPVFADSWRERLAGAPERTFAAVERKLTTHEVPPDAAPTQGVTTERGVKP